MQSGPAVYARTVTVLAWTGSTFQIIQTSIGTSAHSSIEQPSGQHQTFLGNQKWSSWQSNGQCEFASPKEMSQTRRGTLVVCAINARTMLTDQRGANDNWQITNWQLTTIRRDQSALANFRYATITGRKWAVTWSNICANTSPIMIIGHLKPWLALTTMLCKRVTQTNT